MRTLIAFILFFLIVFSCRAELKRIEGLGAASAECVVFSAHAQDALYVASGNKVFTVYLPAASFSQPVAFGGEDIQTLFFSSAGGGYFYACGRRHLFRVKDGRKERIFTCRDEAEIISAVCEADKIYIATSRGLYLAGEDDLIFSRVNGTQALYIYHLSPVGGGLYLSTAQGLYFLSQGSLRRIFIGRREEENSGFWPQVIKEDKLDSGKLWLGTNHGLFLSQDRGLTWRKVYISGMDNMDITVIGQDDAGADTIYLGGPRGFFSLAPGGDCARKVFSGCVFAVAFDGNHKLYLATERGLYGSDDRFPFVSGDREIYSGSVSIDKVQQAALSYNQVHPDKIKRWRRGVKIRSFLPSVNLDYDKTINYDSGADCYFTGPRDWGVSFSWDIGDFFWSTYEDDIDTRARLNTQLRLDILDEVNRLYFERLRLLRRLEAVRADGDKFSEAALRLREVTAALDGYTGGYFSSACNKKVE